MSAERSSTCALSLLVLLASAAGGCDAVTEDFTTVRSDSAGITLVRYSGEDRLLAVDFQEDFRLGGSEDRAGETFYGVTPGTIGSDARGRLYVLDASASRVEIFDGEGRHLRSVGRAGGGPGELGMPFGLFVEPSGRFGVVDVAKRSFVRFDSEGEVLPLRAFPNAYFGGFIHATEDALFVPVQRVEGDDGTRRTDVLVRIAGGDTLTIARLLQPEARAITLSSCGMSFSGLHSLFAPTLRWTARGDRSVVATEAAYEFSLFDGEREVMRVRRSVPPTRATEALAVEELGEGMRVRTQGGEVVCDPREVVEQRGVNPVIPAIGRVAIAPGGGVWVQRGGVRGEPRAIDLFAPDGDYRGTLAAGSPFPLVFLPDGRIVASETDEFDVTRAVVYRVQGL